MPKIPDPNTFPIADPVIGVPQKSPKGEALRGFSQDIRGVVGALSSLRGARLSGLTNVLGEGIRGAGEIAGSYLYTQGNRAYHQQLLQNTQNHTLAGLQQANALQDAASKWDQEFDKATAQPQYQTDPDALATHMNQIVNNDQIINPDGSTTLNSNSTTALKANLEPDAPGNINPITQKPIDPYPQITQQQGKNAIDRASQLITGRVNDWVLNQKTKNAHAAIPLAADQTASDIAATSTDSSAGGINNAFAAAGTKLKTLQGTISTYANALGPNETRKQQAMAVGKAYAAAFIAAGSNHDTNPIIALSSHQNALKMLTTNTDTLGQPIDYKLGPKARQSLANMLQAHISQDERNIERKAKIDNESALAEIEQQKIDTNNHGDNLVAQQATLDWANDKVNYLKGRIQAAQNDPNISDAPKAATIGALDEQLKALSGLSDTARKNIQHKGVLDKQQQLSDQKAARDELHQNHLDAMQTYNDKVTHFIQIANTNPGQNSDEVRDTAVDLMRYGRRMVAAGYLNPDQTKEKEILNIAASTTKWQMKPAMDFDTWLGHFKIGDMQLKQRKKKELEKAQTDMRASIAKSVGELQAAQDNLNYAENTFKTDEQKKIFHEKISQLDKSWANIPYTSAQYNQRKQLIAKEILKQYQPKQPKVQAGAPKPPPGMTLVPPPPPSSLLSTEFAAYDTQAKTIEKLSKDNAEMKQQIKEIHYVLMGKVEKPENKETPGVVETGGEDVSE